MVDPHSPDDDLFHFKGKTNFLSLEVCLDISQRIHPLNPNHNLLQTILRKNIEIILKYVVSHHNSKPHRLVENGVLVIGIGHIYPLYILGGQVLLNYKPSIIEASFCTIINHEKNFVIHELSFYPNRTVVR